MENILSTLALSAKGPSGFAVNDQEPMGQTGAVHGKGVMVAGINLLPSVITPAQSPLCNLIRIFKATAAPRVTRTFFVAGETKLAGTAVKLVSTKSRSVKILL